MNIEELTQTPEIIEWIDSCSSTTRWELVSEADPQPADRCVSVGFIIEDTKEYVCITGSRSTSCVMCRLTIPKVAILSRHKLRKR